MTSIVTVLDTAKHARRHMCIQILQTYFYPPPSPLPYCSLQRGQPKSDTHAVKYTARIAHNTQTCHMSQHTNVPTDGSRQGQVEGIIYTRTSYSIYTEPSVRIYVRVVQYVRN